MAFRIIPRLDIKAPNLVKGIRLEGLRVVGKPVEFAQEYANEYADELFYQDIVASLYERNSIKDLVTETAGNIFIPLTVGGGLRNIEDISSVLQSGADKVSINTAAVKNPKFISEASRMFGSQCIMVAVEAIRAGNGYWEAFTDNGREHTGLDAVDWAEKAVDLGAGELLITSVDREGTEQGYELELLQKIVDKVNVPVVIHGGANSKENILEAAKIGASGAVVSKIFHYKKYSIREVKEHLSANGVEVRL
jgi:cyclase